MRVTPKACVLALLLFAANAAAQEATTQPPQTATQAPQATTQEPATTTQEPAAAAQEPQTPAQAPAAETTPQQPDVLMQSPRIVPAAVDWDAARAAIAAADRAASSDTGKDTPAGDPLARLNAAAEQIFPKISASPVPVLLPFDAAGFLRDTADGRPADSTETSTYLAGFRPTFFFPGPSGYDAAFSLQPQDGGSFDSSFARRVDVQISGLAFVYELDGPAIAQGKLVPELDSQFPGIRRLLLESRLRYTFERFGVPYVVMIKCFDGRRHKRWLSCREADQLAVRFLKALAIAGGTPPSEPAKPTPVAIERPDEVSPDFTYYAPGDILPGTGMRGQSGRPDATVYANIRFPMAQAPAYINSQSFMNWGNCDFTGRVRIGGHGKDAIYSCRVNGIPLVHNEAKNYAYPWRDNFCEHRYFYVSQCPAGAGHQGEDIRPGSCKLRNNGADRCEPYQHDVVAASDGIALRSPGDEAIYLVVNEPGEHVRFRYLHMNPHLLDAAGIVSGRKLNAGEVIGLADDYGERQGGTTYHLHLDLQVPTRQGWIFVNPYMTLVAAYERLIGGRGRVVSGTTLASTNATPGPDSTALTPPVSAATSNSPVSDANMEPNILAGRSAENTGEADRGPSNTTRSEARSEHRLASAEHCTTRFVKGHRRRVCGLDTAERRTRGKHAVRTVDRRLWHEGQGAWHHGRNLHARHERGKARHNRA